MAHILKLCFVITATAAHHVYDPIAQRIQACGTPGCWLQSHSGGFTCQPTRPQWTAMHALGNRPLRVCTPCVGQPVMLETLPAREAGLAPDAVKPDSRQGGLPSASRKRIRKPRQTARQLQQQNTGAGEVVVISDEEDDDFEPDVKAPKR